MLRGEARVKSGQLKGGVLISLTDKGKVLEWQLNIDMSLISDSWPRCPKHDTWMQPMLGPREWRCNVLEKRSHWEGIAGVENSEVFKVDDGVTPCRETKCYRWWRYLD